MAVALTAGGQFVVRDTKDAAPGDLFFDEREWLAFIKGVKAGEFDPGRLRRS